MFVWGCAQKKARLEPREKAGKEGESQKGHLETAELSLASGDGEIAAMLPYSIARLRMCWIIWGVMIPLPSLE